MNKKSYITPAVVLFQIGTKDSFAGEVIISTSTATVIGEGGGELNAKESALFDNEQDGNDEEFDYKPIRSLWDEE